MIFLDTHVVVWLYAGEVKLLSKQARTAIELESCLISPMVVLELQYLFETGRIKIGAEKIVSALRNEIDLQTDHVPFHKLIEPALRQSWTRDPFDRLIVSQASLRQASLVTKDQNIRKHYSHAMW